MHRKKPRLKGDYKVANRKNKKAIARKEASANPTIYACIVDYAPADGVGIYKFTPESYEFTPVKTGDEFEVKGGAAYFNGTFYGVQESGDAYTWNTDTWEETAGPIPSSQVKGIAMTADPVDGTLYSCAWAGNGQSTELVTVNPVTFSRQSTISALDKSFSAIFFDLQGKLLGFDDSGKLYQIDKNNGALTYIGDTGIEAYFDGAAVVDPASGKCFYAATDWECGLYEVDLATCEASLLYNFDDEEELKSIFILSDSPAGTAPAAAKDLSANFPAGALNGTISFIAPATTFDGSAGSGQLSYTVSCNDAVLKTASCNWGEEVNVEYVAKAAGMYSFVVAMSSDAGESRPAAISLWIGNDAPAEPTAVKVTRADGANIISWQAPAGSAHGGYVDFGEVTYRVTRYPDSKVVAEGIKECEYTDELPDGNAPESYYYTVAAQWNGAESGTSTSNAVMVGALYYNSFDNQEQFDEFRSVSLVNDGPVWSYYAWAHAAAVGDNEEGNVSAWLISPAVKLTAGKTYTLEFDVWCSNDSYTENLSVYIAQSDAASEIYKSTPVINKMAINWERDMTKKISVEYTPEVDGTYYIAFNGCSGRDLGSVYIDNVLFYANVTVALPEAPVISGQIMGDYIALITVTAPETDTDGNVLEAIDMITVSRNGELINTIEAPEVGGIYNFIDMLPQPDSYIYTAVAFAATGRSAEGKTIVSTIAAGKPRQAQITSVKETGHTGEVTVEWIAPSTDLNNLPIEEGTLTYKLYADGVADPIAGDIAATSYTWQAVPEGKQQFMSFYVVAVNEAGESAPSRISAPACFGTPDALPYAESFAGMTPSNLWNFYNDDDYSEGHWLFLAASETPEASPYDGDGGMLAFEGEFLDDTSLATTGKIDLGESTSPRLSFWYFAVSGREGKDQLDVLVNDGSGYRTMDSFTMRDAKVDGWTKHTVDLTPFAGKVINLRFVGTSFRTGYFMLIDNIEITGSDKDVSVYTVVAPSSVLPGKPFLVEGVLVNNGNDIRENVTASLYRDGAIVDSKQISYVASGSGAMFTFDQEADASWPESVTYKMVLDLSGDQHPENNVSDDIVVKVVPCTLPTVADLSATYRDDSKRIVDLAWSAPDASAVAPVAYTENFEYYEPLEINPEGDWHFVDADGDNTYGVQLFQFPGMYDPKAYIVLDQASLNVTYHAHSGTRYLASFSAVSKQTDDWMISPELCGDAQTVSLYARSYTAMYGLEKFEILASSKGVEIEDFTLVKAFDNVPEEWTGYSAELPAGTRHFAIRCTSQNTFMFFVDDVTFIPAVHPAVDFEILGYNLFCNNKRINQAPVTDLSLAHTPEPGSAPLYTASVVYDHGESGLCAAVSPSVTGIGLIEGQSLSAAATDGGIILTGNGFGRIVAVDGRVVFSGKVESSLFIALPTGVYIFDNTSASAKVIVK